MTSVRRYTRFVALFKHSLWALVAGTVLALIWIASSNTGENGARLVFSGIPKSETLENIMLKPHYQGVDARNRPYTVLADKATQVDANTVSMTNVHADMASGDAWAALTAGSGLLSLQNKKMELKDGVDMFYGAYEFRTDHAHIDIREGSAYGDAPVEGQGPRATLKADGFNAADHGKVIRFNGSVRVKLYH